MPKLLLGVLDQPYSNGGKSTHEVARILEDKYGVIGYFYRTHKPDVKSALTESVRGAIDNLIMGAPSSVSPFAEGTDKIETAFRQFLSNAEMDGHIDGVPTKASLAGYSKRFKQKSKKDRGRRPSFIDTGLYQSSFRAWVE